MARSHPPRGGHFALLLLPAMVAPAASARARSPAAPPLWSVRLGDRLPEVDLDRLRAKLGNGSQVEFEIVCPISHGVMQDPVSTLAGKTYDRVSIELWLRTHSTDPLTQVGGVFVEDLVPNLTVRAKVAKLIDEYPDVLVESFPDLKRYFTQKRCNSWCVTCKGQAGGRFWFDRAPTKPSDCNDVRVSTKNKPAFNLTAALVAEAAHLRDRHAQLTALFAFPSEAAIIEYNADLTSFNDHQRKCFAAGTWLPWGNPWSCLPLFMHQRWLRSCLKGPRFCGSEGVASFEVVKSKSLAEEDAARSSCLAER